MSDWQPKDFRPNSYDGKPRFLPATEKAELSEIVEKIAAHVAWLPTDRAQILFNACMNVSPINCGWSEFLIAQIAIWLLHDSHHAPLPPAQTMSAGTAETGTGSGLQPASAVAESDAPKGVA